MKNMIDEGNAKIGEMEVMAKSGFLSYIGKAPFPMGRDDTKISLP